MNHISSNERLVRILQASPEQQAAIDRVLAGQAEAPRPASSGPLLLSMRQAAKMIGVSRVTFWRMMKAGKLERVEILPGSFRVRRADVEALAGGVAP